jgi:phage baseplate assembly protein gpV
MSGIVGTIQEIVRQELRGVRVAELGQVEAVQPHRSDDDGDNYGCDVRLKNSGLLLKRVPTATGHIGTAAIPNVGDLVLLAFDLGDVNQPVIIGRLYHDKARAPLNNPDEIVFRLPLDAADDRTIRGAIRNIQANSPPREMLFELPPKIRLQVTDGTVRASAGKTGVALEQPGGSGGTVTVTAGRTKITLSQDGDLTVEAAGAMTLKATGDLTLEGQRVSISARTSMDVSAGTQASLTAKLGATVDGGLSATVQGATVSVKGLTSFSP